MGTSCFQENTIEDGKPEANKEIITNKDKNISKSICKLKIETQSDPIIGTGFFLKFKMDKEIFYCLLTNENIIQKDIINNNNIYIYYDNEEKELNIKLDITKRYIKNFREENLDIAIVEILLDEDNISKDYFLWNEDEHDNNKLINIDIYMLQYTQEKKLIKIISKLLKINKYEFIFLSNIEEHGSSRGNPIFLKNSINAIGIYKERNTEKKENHGNFIYPVINIIKEDIKKKKKNDENLNGKYNWENGDYYIGELKNDIPNGKGIKYDSDGNILYEGNFID